MKATRNNRKPDQPRAKPAAKKTKPRLGIPTAGQRITSADRDICAAAAMLGVQHELGSLHPDVEGVVLQPADVASVTRLLTDAREQLYWLSQYLDREQLSELAPNGSQLEVMEPIESEAAELRPSQLG